MQLPPDFSLKAPKTRDPQSPTGALMRLGGGSTPTPAQDAFSPFARRPPRAAAAAAAVAEAADVQAASAGPESGVGAVLGAGGATAHLSVLAEYPPEVAAEIRTRQVVGSAQPFSLGGGAATGGSAAMSTLCWAAYGQSLVVWRGGLPNASHRPPPPPAGCSGLALLHIQMLDAVHW